MRIKVFKGASCGAIHERKCYDNGGNNGGDGNVYDADYKEVD